MKNESLYAVIEIFQGRLGQVIPCENKRVADGLFKNALKENNPDLEEQDISDAVDEGEFSDGDGYEIYVTGPLALERDTTRKK